MFSKQTVNLAVSWIWTKCYWKIMLYRHYKWTQPAHDVGSTLDQRWNEVITSDNQNPTWNQHIYAVKYRPNINVRIRRRFNVVSTSKFQHHFQLLNFNIDTIPMAGFKSRLSDWIPSVWSRILKLNLVSLVWYSTWMFLLGDWAPYKGSVLPRGLILYYRALAAVHTNTDTRVQTLRS